MDCDMCDNKEMNFEKPNYYECWDCGRWFLVQETGSFSEEKK